MPHTRRLAVDITLFEHRVRAYCGMDSCVVAVLGDKKLIRAPEILLVPVNIAPNKAPLERG